MLELSDLVQGATDLFHAARSQVFGVAHPAGEAAANICHDAVGTASHLYDRAGRTANMASGYIQRAEQGVQKGVHAAEDWVDKGTHSLAARFDPVPAMGPAARMMADSVTMGTQLLGGIGLGAMTMAGGMAHSVVHPIDTALGLEAMLEHTPGPAGNLVRTAHAFVDVARGERSFGGAISRATDPLATAEADAQFWGKLGTAFLDPYRAAIQEGRYGEAVGRGVFDIGSLLIGAGEVCQSGRGIAAAGEMARAADGADLTRAAGATDVTRTVDVAAEAPYAMEATADAVHAVDGTNQINQTLQRTAGTQAERQGGTGGYTQGALPGIPVHDVGLSDRGLRPAPNGSGQSAEAHETRCGDDSNYEAGWQAVRRQLCHRGSQEGLWLRGRSAAGSGDESGTPGPSGPKDTATTSRPSLLQA